MINKRARTRVRVRAVGAERGGDGGVGRLVARRHANPEATLARCLVVEVDRVRRAKVDQEDQVDDLARDELAVPRLERARRHAEEADLLGDRDDQVQLRQAREAGAVTGVEDLLEVAVKSRSMAEERGRRDVKTGMSSSEGEKRERTPSAP